MGTRAVCLTGVAVLMMAACGSDGKNGSTATTSGAPTTSGASDTSTSASSGSSGSGETVKILINGPMTGSSAELGTDMCNGAKLAADEINNGDGITAGPMKGARLEIDCADNPDFSTDVAATIASRYLSDKSIWVSGGYASSAEGLAAAKVVESAGLTIIGSAIAAEFLTEESDNIIALFPDSRGIGYVATDFCKAYYGGSTVGQVTATYSYLDSYLVGEKTALQALNMKLVVDEKYEAGSVTDFSGFVAQLKDAKPDCVFTGDYPPVMEQMLVEARSIDFDAPFIDFGAAGPTETGLKTSGGDGPGVAYLTFAPLEAPAESEWQRVSALWTQKYSKPMGYYPAYAYDTVLTVKYALEAGAGSREDLLGYMAKLDSPGLVGQIKFAENLRIAERPLYVVEQTGTNITDMEQVASYTLSPDGTAKADNVAMCSSRSTCQLNKAG